MKNRTFMTTSPSRNRRRRRGTSRLFVLGAAFMASTAMSSKLTTPLCAQSTLRDTRVVSARTSGSSAVGAADEGQGSQTATFDIPAGTIGAVADRLRAVTGIRIVFANDDIRDLPSPGVSGAMTAEQALDRLLVGTGVGYVFTARDLITMDIRTAEFVSVSGREAPTVSSPKYTTPLRDVPQTIALIPRATIEEQGATTLSETLRNVPGITLQAGEGGGASNTAGDMFNMRGFNASNSLFVDGVRDDGLVSRDVFNLEQVEVFMGPTGSDVGRGTAAGYVNMQTKVPHLGSSSSGMISYGNANRGRATFDVNWSSSGESDSWWSKSAFRVNALWQDGGVPGRDEVEQESRGVAPSLAFGLGTPTRLSLSAQILRQKNLPDYGIPGAAWEEEPLAPTTIRAASPVDQSNYYGSSSAYDHDDASQDSYTVRFEHDVNRRFTLRNQTRYNRADRDAIISSVQSPASYDAVTNLVTISRQGNIRENEIAANQTSMIGRFTTGALRHSSSFGLEFTHESQFAPAITGLGTRAPVDIYSPDVDDPITAFAPARSGALTDGSTDTVSAYFFDTVDLGDRWQVSGGIRVEHYDTKFRSVDAAGLTTADEQASDALTSGKAGILYRLTPAGNVYVSYGTSATPPGGANFALSTQPNNANSPNVDPQLSANFEIGTKWDFANGRLSLNSAVFRTENKNVIFTVDPGPPPIYNQDDSQLVKGITVGALGRITDRWEILGNIGFLDSTFNTQGAVNDGNRLVLTPEFATSIWSTYSWPMGLRLGGGVRQTSEVFINAANTIKSPGYMLVDALAEYEVNTHLSLRLNIYNLFDETYIRNVNNNGGRYNPGFPRSATVTSQVRF